MTTTPLSKEKKGEIALAYLKLKLRKEGFTLSENTKREIANTAKQIGITVEDAELFAEEMVRYLVDTIFPPKDGQQS